MKPQEALGPNISAAYDMIAIQEFVRARSRQLIQTSNLLRREKIRHGLIPHNVFFLYPSVDLVRVITSGSLTSL